MKRIATRRLPAARRRRARRRRPPRGRAARSTAPPQSGDSITVSGQRLRVSRSRRPPSSRSASTSRAATAKAALAANAREMRQVIAAVKAAGGRDVGTQSVSLSQVLGQNGEPTGFAASNVVSATVDLDRAGAVIDAAVERGREPGQRPDDVGRRPGQALPAGAEGGRRRRAAERRDARRRSRPLARQGHLGRRGRRRRPPCRCSRRPPPPTRGTPIEAGTQRDDRERHRHLRAR